MSNFSKKYRPLREVTFISLIYLVFIYFLWETSIIKNIYAILGIFMFYFMVYVLPTLFLFYNYYKYVNHRKINCDKLVESDIDKITLIATEDKIKNRPSAYSLPYHMNFFYLKIYLKNQEIPIFITSLDEYKIEEWAKDKFPNIEIEKEKDFYPTIK